MISLPYRILNYFQKETFVKEHQIFADNLMREKKKYEKNLPRANYNKQISIRKVFKFIDKLSDKERMKLFTISNKWLVEILIQLFSLYENNNKITFELGYEMEKLIKKKNEYWDFFKYSEDPFSYRDYFKISNLEEKGIGSILHKKEPDILKYIKIVKSYDMIIFDKDILFDSKKLWDLFLNISNTDCFCDWISPTENEDKIKNFNLPEWISKLNSLTFFQIIFLFFEQHILLNYEYYIYTNKIYESHNKSKLEELYDEINLVNQLSNEVQFIEKIFSENIIREQANKLNYNNNEFITNLFNELKNSIEFGDDEKEKIIIIIKRLSFLDLHEVANGLEPICESYRQYILNFIKDKIFEELLKEKKPSKKGKKHKKNKKTKIEIKDGLKENEEENKDN